MGCAASITATGRNSCLSGCRLLRVRRSAGGAWRRTTSARVRTFWGRDGSRTPRHRRILRFSSVVTRGTRLDLRHSRKVRYYLSGRQGDELNNGAMAQLVARFHGMEEVGGSNPPSSTEKSDTRLPVSVFCCPNGGCVSLAFGLSHVWVLCCGVLKPCAACLLSVF